MSDVCWPASLLCTVCTVCMLSSSAQIHLTSVSISEWLCNIGDQQEQQQEQQKEQRHTSSLVQWPLYYTGDWWISGDVFFFFLGALSIPAIMYLRSPLWTVGRFLLFFFLLAGVRLKVLAGLGWLGKCVQMDGLQFRLTIVYLYMDIYRARHGFLRFHVYWSDRRNIYYYYYTNSSSSSQRRCVSIQGQLWRGRKWQYGKVVAAWTSARQGGYSS